MTFFACRRHHGYQSELASKEQTFPDRPLNCQSTEKWKTVMPGRRPAVETAAPSLPSLRFEVPEAAQILRMSRAQLYNRICEGTIRPQKDGSRTYITRAELERYVDSCSATPTDGRSGQAELHQLPP
jgi:hypothetical protein